MNAQLKKGILEICILEIIAREDTYGYPLMQEMKNHFPKMDESTIYSILRRLCKDGYTETYIGKESFGPSRKYYHITDSGRTALIQMHKEWDEIKKIVDDIRG
ncbi:MAG: PadR family transcriptional regulator [Acetatifactor sp.]|nr:PadR family transcriptional regulator [Acetatifactor sp.]